MIRFAVGYVLGLITRVWAATWRVRLVVDGQLRLDSSSPFVFAFWHGSQMGLLGAARRRKTAVLVSGSKDGTLQAGAMRALGLFVVRGSSSHRAAIGLKSIVRSLREGRDAAFAADGPRGPLGLAKPGAWRAACATRSQCVPLGCAAEPRLTLWRAWDRFEIPLPFSRVVIVLGAPLNLSYGSSMAVVLSEAIREVNRRATSLLRSDQYGCKEA